jgi:hypothetical protein
VADAAKVPRLCKPRIHPGGSTSGRSRPSYRADRCGLRVEVADVVVGTCRSPRIRDSGTVKSERKGAVLTNHIFESVPLVVPEIVLNGLQSRFDEES